jgi:hypothetical protein
LRSSLLKKATKFRFRAGPFRRPGKRLNDTRPDGKRPLKVPAARDSRGNYDAKRRWTDCGHLHWSWLAGIGQRLYRRFRVTCSVGATL